MFYGRVATATDKLAFDLNDLGGGRRQLRAYVSDGEPEPAGDIEWFPSEVTGDSFSLSSRSGNARMAFAAPRGLFLIGRSGDVRAGRPGVNIIGLDKKC